MGSQHSTTTRMGGHALENLNHIQQWFAHKSVAVVGNAQSLLKQQWGKEIDRHDVVVRINKAAPICYPKLWYNLPQTTGIKTSVWVLNRISTNVNKFVVKLHTQYPKIIQTQPFQDPEEAAKYPYITALGHNIPILKTQLGLIKVSTGLLFLDFLKLIPTASCNVFGFDFKSTPTFYHLFRAGFGVSDDARKLSAVRTAPPEDPDHDFAREREYCLNTLQPIYNIKFHF